MINKITVLVDNDSWILPYANKLVNALNALGRVATLERQHENVQEGDVCFFLGCTKIAKEELLNKNSYNLVVHESNLPKGKGFAPVAWQILDGNDEIPVCLIEAGKEVDSGKIWLTDTIQLSGTELSNEWRELQGNMSITLALKFVNEYKNLITKEQIGESSFYPRRRPADSQLNINKKFADLIPLLRIVDNNDYPAFFEYKGCKYKLEISKYE
ncbi:methionyl-tRNA formyltransferase [Thalassotalea piscium]